MIMGRYGMMSQKHESVDGMMTDGAYLTVSRGEPDS